jgi:hypothetical protein
MKIAPEDIQSRLPNNDAATRRKAALAAGGSAETEAAVLEGLTWLARHQDKDGSWKADSFSAQCIGKKCSWPGDTELSVGTTGLSLLALLGAGFTHLSKDDEYRDPISPGRVLKFASVVWRGLDWLIAHQSPDGSIGNARDHKFMYSQALATQALAEAFGASGAKFLRQPAQLASDYLVGAQNAGEGWHYTPRSGNSDSSTTTWCALALIVARRAGLSVPQSSFEGAVSWSDSVTTGTGEVGYDSKGATGRVLIPWDSTRWADHESLSAGAYLIHEMNPRPEYKERQAKYIAQLLHDPPAPGPASIDYVYWYLGTLAVFHHSAPQGSGWEAWNRSLKNASLPNRSSSQLTCQLGSWNPEVERWSLGGGGRVYATAINVLTLETYYHHSLPGAVK